MWRGNEFHNLGAEMQKSQAPKAVGMIFKNATLSLTTKDTSLYVCVG